MSCRPSIEQFREAARDVHLVPVYRKLLGDSLTPVSAFHHLDTGPCACLFESVIGGEKVGRYSFLTSGPFLLLEAFERKVRITEFPPDRPPTVRDLECDDPLVELKARVDALRSAVLPGLPPFTGGAIGYAGYDTVRYVENLPDAPTDDRRLPDLSFAFYDRMVVFDNVDKTMTVIALARVDGAGQAGKGPVDGGPSDGGPNDGGLEAAYADACRRVEELTATLSDADRSLRPAEIEVGGEVTIPVASNFTPERFEAAVEKCLEYIRAGDIFQVVLSQRFQTKLTAPAFELYRTLRVVNPSPFMFYLRLPQVTLVGSSPEIMVRVVGGKVTVRPLAGTRPRGRDEAEDRRLADELLADPKERAEHVMLVDLGRNDVGRVARYGTVELSDVMVIERYSHVMHITSNVTGQLTSDRDSFDALRACLPAGTVSGAPKVRAMQIIDELEPHRRGPYAGAVGYVDFNGNMDTCIALRTVVIQGENAYVQAGAGIVADSVPAAEFAETQNKARGLLRAIEITERRAGTK